MNYYFEDFTEENYRRLLQLARDKYRFISYDLCQIEGKTILWRHDIDYSVHRAAKLAQIEYEEGVKATYFIHLHNEFYHFYEKEIVQLFKDILKKGHDIGLHFDTSFYDLTPDNRALLEKQLIWEKSILEQVLEVKIDAFSFHNPTVGGDWLAVSDYKIANMINTYAKEIVTTFNYCSDSNGYWRHKRLYDVLAFSTSEKLQILTHPEWWTPEVMSPRARISRCIAGRANKQHQGYDDFLSAHGRTNVK